MGLPANAKEPVLSQVAGNGCPVGKPPLTDLSPAPRAVLFLERCCVQPSDGAITAKRGTHEKAEKIWVFIKGQKVSEKYASENRLETQARRKEGSRRDGDGLNGGSSRRTECRRNWMLR